MRSLGDGAREPIELDREARPLVLRRRHGDGAFLRYWSYAIIQIPQPYQPVSNRRARALPASMPAAKHLGRDYHALMFRARYMTASIFSAGHAEMAMLCP